MCGVTYTDPCTGDMFPCPATCASGQECGNVPGNGDTNRCCTPATCDVNKCNTFMDPCTGATVDCSTNCASGDMCSPDNTNCCTPATVCPANYCGATWTDPCTNLPITCNLTCAAGTQCGSVPGNGDTNMCCTPNTTCQPNQCNSFTDPCTGTVVNCGEQLRER